MTEAVTCPTCGERTTIPGCPSCGGEVLVRGADEPSDRTDSDRDQTLSDRDQTASEQDQTWSDHDQTASDGDQRSADEDQSASDIDLAAGGDAITHRRSAVARERASRERGEVSALRHDTSTARARTGDDRDQTAELRDQGAEMRDASFRRRNVPVSADVPEDDIVLRAKADRARAAADRAKAAEDRARAAADREEAVRERAEALRTRAESAEILRRATTDDLTGAWTRKFGLEQVSRELERAERTGARLVLAFIDVDGLKQVNDTHGHLAGDTLLQLVGETVRGHLRPYDVVVRFGGDELICALPNLSSTEARPRFEKIAAALAAADTEHSVSFGLADAEPSVGLQELLARADADLLRARHASKASG